MNQVVADYRQEEHLASLGGFSYSFRKDIIPGASREMNLQLPSRKREECSLVEGKACFRS